MKKLYRSNNKMLAGVCGGIGEYADIDPTLIRLLWVVVTVLTGIVPGIIGYIVAAIVIPQGPEIKIASD